MVAELEDRVAAVEHGWRLKAGRELSILWGRPGLGMTHQIERPLQPELSSAQRLCRLLGATDLAQEVQLLGRATGRAESLTWLKQKINMFMPKGGR
jgi:hypothetical protein